MKKINYIWPLALVCLFVGGVVFAQNGASSQQGREGLVVKARSIVACENIGKNIEKRITNFEKSQAKHVGQYEKTQKRITTLVDRLEAEGRDVTTLRADLVTFEQKITKFKADYATYVNDLRGTKEFTCGKSEGEFKAKLAIARAQLKVVHDDSVAVRTYWAQTIKPQIEAMKTAPVVTPTVEEGAI